MTDKKDNEEILKQLIKEKIITSAPEPITPLNLNHSGTLLDIICADINTPLDPIIPITGIELMERWSIDAIALILFSYECSGMSPYFPEGFRNDVNWLLAQDSKAQEDYLAKCIYDRDVIDVAEVKYADHLAAIRQERREQPEPVNENTPAPQIEPQAENYFKRTDNNHWTIKFGNEHAPHVDHVDGFLYIAHILEKLGKDISDQTLYQLAKGVPLKNTIDTNGMIERNLSKGFKPQSIGTDKERKICQAKYHELEGKLETASLEEQEEIKEQMEKLVPYLNMKGRNFADPNDKKAQSNVTKRIDLAYGKLKEENMPELATHLEDNIKTGDYGRKYIGLVTWETKINK